MCILPIGRPTRSEPLSPVTSTTEHTPHSKPRSADLKDPETGGPGGYPTGRVEVGSGSSTSESHGGSSAPPRPPIARGRGRLTPGTTGARARGSGEHGVSMACGRWGRGRGEQKEFRKWWMSGAVWKIYIPIHLGS